MKTEKNGTTEQSLLVTFLVYHALVPMETPNAAVKSVRPLAAKLKFSCQDNVVLHVQYIQVETEDRPSRQLGIGSQ